MTPYCTKIASLKMVQEKVCIQAKRNLSYKCSAEWALLDGCSNRLRPSKDTARSVKHFAAV
ncbi:hypothetical protein Pan97_02780 [Bremerella volcania]|uniref:Uncharacterized protein n=1 Tax=Bremerella volcania TaxID=2527984 RepID=A0A518C244_9BACT|nr:hypothetical protein Pan97_02780 [Bremerella volcania]